MAKNGKRYNDAAQRYDKQHPHTANEGVELVKSLTAAKFDETLELAARLGVDPRKSDQMIRGTVSLPSGTGTDVRVAVFAQGEAAAQASEAGADVVGLEDLAERVNGGELDFDVVIASPDAMRVVGSLGRVLGPRGLMPNPKTGTVTADVETAVKNAKSGQVQFRADRGGIVHGRVGTVGFEPQHVKENLEALIQDLRRARPAASKGHYLKRITLSTTMGPGLRIDEGSLSV